MSKTYSQGTVLMQEKPFVFILHEAHRLKLCDHCLDGKNIQSCRLCRKVGYCSIECEKEAWAIHKFECANMKRIDPKIVPDSVRMLSRIFYKLNYSRGSDIKGFYGDKPDEYRQFKDLESHYNELRCTNERMSDIMCVANILHDYMGEDETIPPLEQLMMIYGKVMINSFNIMDPTMLVIGSGLYLGASRFDHSCSPNAVATFSGTTLSIRLLKPIPQFAWSKVFISYIDVLQSTPKRMQELRKGYFFECNCEVCQDKKQLEEMLSMRCPNKTCPEPIHIPEDFKVDSLPNDLKCKKCGEEITKSRIQSYLTVLEFVETQLDRMKETSYLDVCQTCLRKQDGLFHKNNVYYLQILDSAFSAAIDLSHWKEAREYGEKLIPGMKKYYDEMHPILGHTLLKTAKLILLDVLQEETNSLEKEKVCAYVENAAKIFRVCYGEEHKVFKEHVTPHMKTIHLFSHGKQ